jgi:hypothetical protein
MATDRTGYIDVADVNSVIFTDSKKDDFIIYTETSNQNILIGTQLSNVSAMAIRSNNVHVTNRLNIGGGSNTPAVALEVNTTDSLLLPKGTTSERPVVPVQGYVRYNTSINTFEGFGAGNAWGSLGGVKDTNQDTYISAESFPTSNDDNLVFYNSNIEKMRITRQGYMGLGTSNPTYLLHVNGQGYFNEDITINANLAVNKQIIMQGLRIRKNTSGQANFSPTSVPGVSNDSLGNLQLLNQNNQSIIFLTNGSNEVGRFTPDGKFAVGTSTPSTILEIAGTDAMLIPKGTTAQRPLTVKQGQMRYNTDTNTFEGFGAGSTWGSLGGVKDTNQDTYISAESFPTSNDDILRFYNSNNETMRIMPTGRIGLSNQEPSERLEVSGGNAKFNSNVYVMSRLAVAGSNPTEILDVKGNAKVSSNIYAFNRIGIATSNPAVSLEINSTDAILLPKGTTLQRPSAPVQGHVRYNADINTFEGYGLAWGSLGGVKSTDQQTYVSAEMYPTSNDGNIRFVNSNVERMRVTTGGNVGIGTSAPSFTLEVAGATRINSNLTVLGNLSVSGVTTTVDSTNVNIADAVIRVNNGAVYNSGLQAGVEVNRGTGYSNYYFVFDETSKYFKIGQTGQLQAVATREDTPAANGVIPYYDSTSYRYLSASTFVYSGGKVGINQANPAYTLDVGGTINATVGNGGIALQGLNSGLTSGQFIHSVLGYSTTSSNCGVIKYIHNGVGALNYIQFGIWGQNNITCGANGNVGINQGTPGYPLDVTGAIYASGDITALSDRRYKQDIQPLEGCLDKISKLSGYSYTRTDYKEGERQIGLIAQEVEEVIPEAVSYDKENDRYGLNYGCLVAPLIEAIKVLNAKLEAQDKIIQALLKAVPISP